MGALAARWTAARSFESALPILIVVAAGVGLTVTWHVPAVALTAAVCAFTAALTSVRVALLALAFLAPFDGYIPSLVVYQDFLAADVAGFAIIAGQWRRGARVPLDGAVVAALSALALLAAFHLLSLGPVNARDAAGNVARFIYFAALVAAIASAASELPLRAIGALLVAGVVIRFVHEGIYYFSSPAFVLHPSFQFGAMTSNPNTLAGLAACVVPIASSLALNSGRSRRVVAGLATVLLLGGILLSYSKGAWVTVPVTMTVWVWHVARRRAFRGRRIGAGLVLAGLIVALLPQGRQIPGLIIERWTSQGSVISNRERVRYLETAAVLIRQNPVLGVGLERFGAEYVAARNALRGPDDPHNGYLMVAAELGVPALGCYLFLLAVIVVTSYRQAHSADERDAPIRIAVHAGVAGLLVFQLFSAEPLTSRILWVIMAVAIAPTHKGGQEPAASASPAVQRVD